MAPKSSCTPQPMKDEEGKAIAAYVDGAVQAISEAQLKEELKKQ